MNTVAIVGGGIAGLSIAHEIRKRAPEVQLVILEGSERAGGTIKTERISGFVCEVGADGFLDNAPDTLRLVEELGISSRLQRSSDTARRRFIYHGGRLHEVPVAPGAFLTTGLLSAGAKARVLWEPFAASPPGIDESIHAFAARRIGREAADVLIDSMVSGIFGGDARKLSLRACFPRMYDMEREHGGLFRAMLATRRRRARGAAMGAPAGILTSFKGGMTELVDALAHSLRGELRTSSPVRELRPHTFGSYWLDTPGDRLAADAVVLAGPSSQAAELTRAFDPALSSALQGIATAPLAVLCLGFDEAAVTAERGPLNGFGFLVPRGEGIRLLGALWETTIYPNRAPEGAALIRVIIGGGHDPGIIDVPDDELLRIVRSELETTMGLRVPPIFTRIIRHKRGIPQYTIGHMDRLGSIEAALQAHPGLFVAGNSYRGVAINSCVAEAGPVADRVIAALRDRPRETRRPLTPTAPGIH